MIALALRMIDSPGRSGGHGSNVPARGQILVKMSWQFWLLIARFGGSCRILRILHPWAGPAAGRVNVTAIAGPFGPFRRSSSLLKGVESYKKLVLV
jgi:hypothetical protein